LVADVRPVATATTGSSVVPAAAFSFDDLVAHPSSIVSMTKRNFVTAITAILQVRLYLSRSTNVQL
jgi:hypothetical protein